MRDKNPTQNPQILPNPKGEQEIVKLQQEKDRMAIIMFIDGPNFVNQVWKLKQDKEYFYNTLNFKDLRAIIQAKVKSEDMASHPYFDAFFVYSNMPKLGPFERNEIDKYIDYIGNNGVIPKLVSHSDIKNAGMKVEKYCPKCEELHYIVCSKCNRFFKRRDLGIEKAVDTKIITMMFEEWLLLSEKYELVFVVFSADKDYIPAFELLTKLGVNMIPVGLGNIKKYPKELIHNSYTYFKLEDLIDKMEKRGDSRDRIVKAQ